MFYAKGNPVQIMFHCQTVKIDCNDNLLDSVSCKIQQNIARFFLLGE